MKFKNAGIGQEWVFALAILFGLTVLVLTFNTVYNYHLGPVIIDLLPESDVGVEAENGINMFLNIWNFLPYIIGFMVILFMLIISVKKEPVEREF